MTSVTWWLQEVPLWIHGQSIPRITLSNSFFLLLNFHLSFDGGWSLQLCERSETRKWHRVSALINSIFYPSFYYFYYNSLFILYLLFIYYLIFIIIIFIQFRSLQHVAGVKRESGIAFRHWFIFSVPLFYFLYFILILVQG